MLAVMEPQTRKYKNKCCVPGCTDRDNKRHRFPRDPDLCRRWVENIKSPHLEKLTCDQIYRSCFVCDLHFARDFVVPGTLRGLRKDAIPSMHLSDK
jgi:hypothetical protein